MSTPLRTRIMLADDHPVVRRGLSLVLDAAPDLTVVAEAADGIEAVELGLREDVDLAILDVAMPRRTGLHAARELTRRRPGLRVLMLSMHDVEAYCFEALKAGASGYVLKTVADRDLVEACRAAMRGEPFLYPPTIRTVHALLPRRPRTTWGPARRSPRASRRSRSSSPSRTAPRRSPTCWPSARGRSNVIARTSSPASGCAIGWR